uniref:Uncharacterized protein n=1 Tax=Acinetobacter baumannii TaxID=470 RepID=A0A482F3N1_ACIBA|nr:hypothetical protein [Acinetobacter baumannii]
MKIRYLKLIVLFLFVQALIACHQIAGGVI